MSLMENLFLPAVNASSIQNICLYTPFYPQLSLRWVELDDQSLGSETFTLLIATFRWLFASLYVLMSLIRLVASASPVFLGLGKACFLPLCFDSLNSLDQPSSWVGSGVVCQRHLHTCACMRARTHTHLSLHLFQYVCVYNSFTKPI